MPSVSSERENSGALFLFSLAWGLHPAEKSAKLPRAMSEARKVIEVVAAIIMNAAGQVLAVKCPEHKHGGGWEFPGGKIEPGETPQAATSREILEELGVQIEVGELLHTVEWNYPAFHLSMRCYISRLLSDTIQLREHTDSRWLNAATLHTVDWLPADADLLPHVERLLQNASCAKDAC